MATPREAARREPLHHLCEPPVNLKPSPNNELFKKGGALRKSRSFKLHCNTYITQRLQSPRPVTTTFHRTVVWHNVKFPQGHVSQKGCHICPHRLSPVPRAGSSGGGSRRVVLAQQSPPEFSTDAACAHAGRGGTRRHHPPWSARPDPRPQLHPPLQAYTDQVAADVCASPVQTPVPPISFTPGNSPHLIEDDRGTPGHTATFAASQTPHLRVPAPLPPSAPTPASSEAGSSLGLYDFTPASHQPVSPLPWISTALTL